MIQTYFNARTASNFRQLQVYTICVATKPRDPQNGLTLRSGWIHSQLGFGFEKPCSFSTWGWVKYGQVIYQKWGMNIHKNIIYIHLPGLVNIQQTMNHHAIKS